jgi:hypothetical protein
MTVAVAVIEDSRKARAVLPPLRQQILSAAQEPASSTSIAAALGLPRQRVNYHVRQLAAAGFLKRAGRRRRRGLVEQRWVAAARTLLLAPQLDDSLTVDLAASRAAKTSSFASARSADRLPEISQAGSDSTVSPAKTASPPDDVGATYLLALATTVQREVAAGARAQRKRGKQLATLALDAELRFESAAQRARFASAIEAAIRDAIATHTTASAAGPAFRLAFGVYPIPEAGER